MNFKKIFLVVTMALATGTSAFAADTVQGYINMSGNVPTFFELWVRGVPGDLDFSPRVVVNDRLLGIFHLKYNVGIASLTVQSDKANGIPQNAGGADWGGTIAYEFGDASCLATNNAQVAVPSGSVATSTMGGGMNIANASANQAALVALGYGVEEDCDVTATWTGVAADLPLAGTYSMKITATMVSN